jgi:hypothetical protein
MYSVWTWGFWDTLLESNVCLVIVCLLTGLLVMLYLGFLSTTLSSPKGHF